MEGEDIIYQIRFLLMDLSDSEFERGMAMWRGADKIAKDCKIKSKATKEKIISLIESKLLNKNG